MWFAQAEASFCRSRIVVPMTKYDCVLMKFLASAFKSIRDTVNDATPDHYELIKACLLHSYGKTKWQLAYAVLDHPSLGDAQPSALMDNMHALMPPNETPATLFQALFLRRLLSDICQQLASRDFASAIEMAANADVLSL